MRTIVDTLAVLPERSVAVPVTVVPAVSPVSVVPPEQDWMPTLSAHVNVTVTSALFQPFAFAAVRVKLIVGSVVSSSVSVATCGSWSEAWSQNSEFTCTTSVDATPRRELLTRMWSSVCELPSNT